MQNFLHVECPSCHSKYSVDRDELTKPRKVKCVDCGYQWIYTINDDKANLTNSSKGSNELINEIDVEDDDRGDFDYNLDENTHVEDIDQDEENNKDGDDLESQNDYKNESTDSDGHEESEEKNNELGDDLDDLFSDLDDSKNKQILKQDLEDKDYGKDNEEDENDFEEDKGERDIEEENEEKDEDDDLDDLFSDLDDIKNEKYKKNVEEKKEVEKDSEDIDEEDEEEEDDDEDGEEENRDYEDDRDDEDREDLEENDENESEENENESEENESDDLVEEDDDGNETEGIEKDNEEEESLLQKILKYGAIGILILMLLGLLFSFGLNSYSVLPNSLKSALSVFGVKNIDGLEIIDLRPKIIVNRENSFNIIVNGNIANLSNKEKNIPEILIFVYGKNNDVRKYSFKLDKKILKAMEYQKFNYKIFAIDFEPTKIEVKLINGIGKYVNYK